MIIIGEKINGAIPSTARAIEARDADYIRNLAIAQDECGADYIDVCAGTETSKEYDALCWLIDVVQDATEKPLCLDSPDPRMLVRVFERVKRPGLINSISAEGEKCDILIPLLVANPEWSVIALCSGNEGVVETAEQKLEVCRYLMGRLNDAGITNERVIVDPLVLAISAIESSAVEFCRAIEMIHEEFPGAKVEAAISNIGFGMPARGLLNRTFLALCLEHGLDAAVCDPTSRELIGTMYATELFMQKDRHGRKFNTAYRKGKIGPKKQ